MADPLLIPLRVPPSDGVVAAAVAALRRAGAAGAAVVSAAGSVCEAVYATATADASGGITYAAPERLEGVIELLALGGHLGRTAEGEVANHLHATFAREDGVVVGGHLFEARALVTVELTLITARTYAWSAERTSHATAPAPTFLLTPERTDGPESTH